MTKAEREKLISQTHSDIRAAQLTIRVKTSLLVHLALGKEECNNCGGDGVADNESYGKCACGQYNGTGWVLPKDNARRTG